ncbi:MAG TPA: hypothetical protein VKB09_09475 [Thermomicrobiales bacterium]|nr:hypothetical protein [Thermomicrobiales bacterium]
MDGLAPLVVVGTAVPAVAEAQRGSVVDVASVVSLQRTHGNAHVTRVLRHAGWNADRPNPVQRDAVVAGRRTFPVPHARWLIKGASAGAGTDEDAIYAAIRQCDDRAGLKADQEVQRLLKSEMKGHDLWKAQLLLEFGDESRFPPAAREIWGATKGAGTDEERIYKAVGKLTAGQLDELLTIPGLEGILKADLNKGEMKRATGGAGVRERHRKNVAFVTTVLTEMRKPGNLPIIRNAAEWLVPAGGGAAKDDLFILTKTHDAAARAKKHGKTNEVAYFGDAPSYPADTADYEIAITSTRNIHFAEPSVAGEHSSKQVWLMEPKRHGMTAVQSFLVHEVQHDADKHERDPDWAKAYKSPEESWVRYKTEFRAYWVDGHRDPPRYSDASGSATDAKFDNAKQEAIFLHMYGTGPNDVYAEWLRPNYDGNITVNGKKFQDLVHGYTRPEGINLVNSPRIDNFYRRLRACAKTDTNLRVPPLWDLKAAAEALDADDRAYVNTAAAAELQKLMKDRLAATPFKKIAKIVNGGRLPGWAGGP